MKKEITFQSLFRDPCVQEWQAAMEKNGDFFNRPIEALGEKKAFAGMVIAPHIPIFMGSPEQPVQTPSERTKKALMNCILHSQCVFLSEEMCELMFELGKKIEASINEGLIFDKKLLPYPVIWLSTPKGFNTYASHLHSKEKLKIHHDALLLISPDHFNLGVHPASCFGFFANDKGINVHTMHTMSSMQEALCLLLEEKIVKFKSERMPRQFRRQIDKLSNVDSEETIQVAYLRTYDYQNKNEESDEKNSFEYVHQWIVRGHIRNQFFPATNTHKLIWIDPYRKGPEDAPFLESVKALVR